MAIANFSPLADCNDNPGVTLEVPVAKESFFDSAGFGRAAFTFDFSISDGEASTTSIAVALVESANETELFIKTRQNTENELKIALYFIG